MNPNNFLNPKEAELVSEYIADKEAFVKEQPELAIKALELYNEYIKRLTKHYIETVRHYRMLEASVDLNITPFGIYFLLAK